LTVEPSDANIAPRGRATLSPFIPKAASLLASDRFVSLRDERAERGEENVMDAATLQALALLVSWLTVGFVIRRSLGEEEISRQSRRHSRGK